MESDRKEVKTKAVYDFLLIPVSNEKCVLLV